ncbi:MAG: type II toxin-antitoxin system RelE/ParE family toxin [Bacteroidota bacterium]|nr:type II toxin-antitoxin system RelE/ParE family toxin [Bacteroidota bacterium]
MFFVQPKNISKNYRPKIVKRIFPALENLSGNPRPAGSKKLVGQDENLWRIRIGDYRIVYLIEDKIKVVEVRKAGHRKDIYE